MGDIRYIIRSSYGNDSIALIQWAREAGLKDVVVAYSDTGWATDEWKERVAQAEAWVRASGFEAVSIPSVGFEQNVFDQTEAGMWPTRMRKHCTKYLKILPFLAWVKQADPDRRAVVLVGVRRAESVARRTKPAFMLEADDGRHVLHPLVEWSDADRDAMVLKTPIPLLDHRSDECAICIHANRDDLRRAPKSFIDKVEEMEARTGTPMFHPGKFMGATGIREVRRWADSERGKYRPPNGEAPEYPLLDAMADRQAEEFAPCDDDRCGL